MQKIILSENSLSYTVHGEGDNKITNYPLVIGVKGQDGEIKIEEIVDHGTQHIVVLEVEFRDNFHTVECERRLYNKNKHIAERNLQDSAPTSGRVSISSLTLGGALFSGFRITNAEVNKFSSENSLIFDYFPNEIEINECRIQDELNFHAGCKSPACISIKNGSIIGTLDLSKQSSVKVEVQSKTNISNLTYDFVHQNSEGLIEIDAQNSTIHMAEIKFNPCGSIIRAIDCDFEELTISAVNDSHKDNNSKSDIDFSSSRVTKVLKIDDETIKNVRITMPVLRKPFYKRTLPLTNPNNWHDMYAAFSNLKRNDLSNLCYALYFGSKKNDILSKLYFWLADAGLSWGKPVLIMIFLNLIIFPCLYAFIVSGYCHFESCPFGKAVESVIKLSLLTALKELKSFLVYAD